MVSDGQLSKINTIVKTGSVKTAEPMSAHTTLRVGGAAEVYIEAPRAEFLAVLSLCKNEGIPCTVIGNGSNLLVGDGGIEGVVLSTAGMNSIRTDRDERIMVAEAGVPLPRLAGAAASQGYAGLEFAAGIPGTVGGAVAMNAGAYGGEIADVIVSAEIVRDDGEIVTLNCDEMSLSYRHSILLEGFGYMLLAAFRMSEGDEAGIRVRMNELMAKRAEKQPLELPSAGSTFKRPEGHFAGQLIEQSRLRGYRVGGAAVSEKHCGFVVNLGGATAADVRAVIDHVTERVYADSGVRLEPEVRFLGTFL